MQIVWFHFWPNLLITFTIVFFQFASDIMNFGGFKCIGENFFRIVAHDGPGNFSMSIFQNCYMYSLWRLDFVVLYLTCFSKVLSPMQIISPCSYLIVPRSCFSVEIELAEDEHHNKRSKNFFTCTNDLVLMLYLNLWNLWARKLPEHL